LENINSNSRGITSKPREIGAHFPCLRRKKRRRGAGNAESTNALKITQGSDSDSPNSLPHTYYEGSSKFRGERTDYFGSLEIDGRS